MLALVTTLTTIESNPTDSLIGLSASTEYIINTENIVKMKVEGTNDSELKYKLNVNEDRTPEFRLEVNETNAAINTASDVSPDSNMIELDVFEDADTYSEAVLLTTTTAKFFNVKDIVWVDENSSQTMSRLLVCVGGQDIEAIFADVNLEQIIDLVKTGTTSTTTTSTSTTSTTTT